MYSGLGKVAKKCNEFEGKLGEVKVESGGRLIRLNNLLVRQACIDKILRGRIEQSVAVFDEYRNSA